MNTVQIWAKLKKCLAKRNLRNLFLHTPNVEIPIKIRAHKVVVLGAGEGVGGGVQNGSISSSI